MTLREEIEKKISNINCGNLQDGDIALSDLCGDDEINKAVNQICQIVKERLENIQYAPGKKVNDFEECSFHYCNGLEKLITELEEKSEE